MQVSVSRDVLGGALSKAGGVIERRQTLPILANLLVIVSEGQLELVGTDLEIEVRTTLDAKTDGEGDLTLPARKILDICRALPEGSDISIEMVGDKAIIRSGRARFTLGTLPAKDYPASQIKVAETSLSLRSRDLRKLLEKTAFAMALQDVRYYLNGLLLEQRGEILNAVATDGHRLAKASRRLEAPLASEVQIILPRKTVLEVLRHLEEKDDLAQLDIGSKFVRLKLGHTLITSKLIDARYPDYERVIPKAEGMSARIEKEVLRQALARTAILSNEKFKGVLLSFESGVLRLKAHNPEQDEATEEIPMEYEGDALEIGFNVEYLLDVVGAIVGREIDMRLIDESSSIRINEADEQENTFVIMPMRL